MWKIFEHMIGTEHFHGNDGDGDGGGAWKLRKKLSPKSENRIDQQIHAEDGQMDFQNKLAMIYTLNMHTNILCGDHFRLMI